MFNEVMKTSGCFLPIRHVLHSFFVELFHTVVKKRNSLLGNVHFFCYINHTTESCEEN
jgi:hypothetical protein